MQVSTQAECLYMSSTADKQIPPYFGQENTAIGTRSLFNLDKTAIDFCTLYIRIQSHTEERFGAYADLEGPANTIIPKLWKYTGTKVANSWFVKGSHMLFTLICVYYMENLGMVWDINVSSFTQYVHPYACDTGNDFFKVDDNDLPEF